MEYKLKDNQVIVNRSLEFFEINSNADPINNYVVKGCYFKNVDIDHCRFVNQKFIGCDFINCDIRFSDLSNCEFDSCRFERCSISYSDLTRASFICSKFSHCDITSNNTYLSNLEETEDTDPDIE